MPKPITPDVSMFMDELGQLPNAKHHLQFLSGYDTLEELATQGKPEIVLKVKQIDAAKRVQMQWLADTLDIQEHNDAEELKHGESLGFDENEIEQFYEAQYQEYTELPALETWEEWLVKDDVAQVEHLKKKGIEFKGVDVSLDQVNQNGIVATYLFSGLIKSQGGSVFPFQFKAITAEGEKFIELVDEGEMMSFIAAFGVPRIGAFNQEKEIETKKKDKKEKKNEKA